MMKDAKDAHTVHSIHWWQKIMFGLVNNKSPAGKTGGAFVCLLKLNDERW